jgi:hypothetical protein
MVGPAAFAQAARLFAGVPEPSSMILVALCVAGLLCGTVTRRRTQ